MLDKILLSHTALLLLFKKEAKYERSFKQIVLFLSVGLGIGQWNPNLGSNCSLVECHGDAQHV